MKIINKRLLSLSVFALAIILDEGKLHDAINRFGTTIPKKDFIFVFEEIFY